MLVQCFNLNRAFNLFQLLSKSLDQVDEEVWTANCGEELAKQIPLYSNMIEEKVLCSCFL